jgi:NAD(P)-dependent dehydrogenase (short-subunit alcohol dehydrogenase family)
MDLQLKDRRAIVTGGSVGIGKQVARVLVEEGARVAIVARGQAQLDSAAAEFGDRIFPIQCDTGSDGSVKAMVAAAMKRFGGIDILVNGAAQPGGQSTPPKLAAITGKAVWNDMNVKVMGYLRCIREVVALMGPGGRIINISGLAARSTGSIIGSMRNVAVAAMTKNLADELGSKGISVIVVHPSMVRTEKTAGVVKARAVAAGRPETEVIAEMAKGNVLNRVIDAAEVANVIAFLCSPKAIAINGDAIVVGGGVPRAIYY